MTINRDWWGSLVIIFALTFALFQELSFFFSRANTASGGIASPPRPLGKERGAGDNDFPAAVFALQIFVGGGGAIRIKLKN